VSIGVEVRRGKGLLVINPEWVFSITKVIRISIGST